MPFQPPGEPWIQTYSGRKFDFARATALGWGRRGRPEVFPGVDAAKASLAAGKGRPFPTPQPDGARLPLSPRPWRGARVRLYWGTHPFRHAAGGARRVRPNLVPGRSP